MMQLSSDTTSVDKFLFIEKEEMPIKQVTAKNLQKTKNIPTHRADTKECYIYTTSLG